jgi:drug/metabolite transporter (DMT)-like permease
LSYVRDIEEFAPPRSYTCRDRTRRSRWKTPLFLVLVVLSNLAGDVCLRFGLRQTGNLLTQSPIACLQAIVTPWVGLGVSFYALWILSQLALLSWADLSYVLPITSIGYALTALAGRLLFGESISQMRWLGISFIVFGVALVTRTDARTAHRQRSVHRS